MVDSPSANRSLASEGERRMRRACAPAAAALVLGIVAGLALADGDARHHAVWGPALAAQEAAEAEARRALGVADTAVLRSARGLWARLDVLPSAAWSGGPGRATSGAASLDVSGLLSWRDDDVAVASALLARHRTFVGQVEAVHRSVRATTSAYLELRRAHVALAQAEAAVASRRATFERAEASFLARVGAHAPPSAAGDAELELARLELERALAGVARAARDLAAAERRATGLGIDARSAEATHWNLLEIDPLEGWRLAPPPPDAEGSTVERRRIERALALARLEREGAWSALDDVRLEGTLTGRDARLRLGVSLDEGRPGAFLEASLRDAARPSWGMSMRARVRIDDTWADDLEAARWSLADADAALAEALADEPWEAGAAQIALHDAEEDVAFAERALELGRAALRTLDAERLAVAAAARAGDAGAEERLERFDAAYARAALGHLRERDAFLRAWSAYLRSAERAWVRAGTLFELRAPGR